MLDHSHFHHHHDPEDQDPRQLEQAMDPASRHLANALRVSFRLLTVIMIIMMGVYLFTGVKFIEPHQVGIKKFFGRIDGVVDQGLAYTWPYPVGDIDIISIKTQELAIEDFWLHETPRDKTKPLSERSAPRGGLRPGWDGALLTGDRNLLHVKLNCLYVITDPEAFKRNIPEGQDAVKPQDEVIRSAICQAAIHAAAQTTADSLMRAETIQDFLNIAD